MSWTYTTKKSFGSNSQFNSAGLCTRKRTKKQAQKKQLIAVPRLDDSNIAGKRVRGLVCEEKSEKYMKWKHNMFVLSEF